MKLCVVLEDKDRLQRLCADQQTDYCVDYSRIIIKIIINSPSDQVRAKLILIEDRGPVGAQYTTGRLSLDIIPSDRICLRRISSVF